MKKLFKELFQYHFEFNQKLRIEIEKEFDNLPKRTHELFCHVLNAHQIWNARILKLNTYGVNDVHKLSMCDQINQINFDTRGATDIVHTVQ